MGGRSVPSGAASELRVALCKEGPQQSPPWPSLSLVPGTAEVLVPRTAEVLVPGTAEVLAVFIFALSSNGPEVASSFGPAFLPFVC